MNPMLFLLYRLFFPKHCAVCGALLRNGEEMMCLTCETGLPLTGYGHTPGNPAEQRFWGRIELQRASSFFFYAPDNGYRSLILQLKYMGRKDIGRYLGRMAGSMLQKEGFFEGIDGLLTVPLHPKRLRKRGYNQSDCIAQGISDVTGIPIERYGIVRTIYSETQTHKQLIERWTTTRQAFALHPKAKLYGKHLLVIDDVLTTGATLSACAEAVLQQASSAQISIFTLGIAHHD